MGAIIEGLRNPNFTIEVRLAGIIALNNSLNFTAANFEVQEQRDVIMKAICETTQSPDVKVRQKAYECFAKVADFYYDKLPTYVKTIFDLTANAIRTDDPLVGFQAIEFWMTVCETEMDILDDINQGLEVTYLKIAEQAVSILSPVLLEAMTKQSTDTDDDDWDLSMAAASCVDSLTRTVQDPVVDCIMPFITSNVTNSDWRFKEASVVAFGSILEGPSSEKLHAIVGQGLPVFIHCLQDASAKVRESTAWTLGRICQFRKSSISPEMLSPMINALGNTLEDRNPKVASQACFAVHNLAEACEEEKDAQSNVISHFMTMMLQKLFNVAARNDWEEENLRVSAYEAVNMIVANCALDMRPIVMQVLTEALNRLEQTFSPQFSQKEKTGSQAMLCSLIGECTKKLELKEFVPFADRSMQLLLQVFQIRSAAAHEDAFLAISYVIDKLQGEFIRYLTYLLPPLMQGLHSIEEYQVCTIAVGIVGDLCRALVKQMLPYCDDIMKYLLELLKSSELNKSVKPHVISCFADVALAIEGDFERYTPVILNVLKSAGERTEETDDEELMEYINTLRAAILEAYTGVIQVP